jgi:hypothetical protein
MPYYWHRSLQHGQSGKRIDGDVVSTEQLGCAPHEHRIEALGCGHHRDAKLKVGNLFSAGIE